MPIDPVTIATVVSAAINVISNLMGGNAAADAAKERKRAMDNALEGISQSYGQAQGFADTAGQQIASRYQPFQPLTQDVISQLRGEVNNGVPSTVRDYLSTRGEQDIARSMAARGLSRSSAFAGAQSNFQSNLANQLYQQRLNMLQQLHGTGAGMAGQQAGQEGQLGQLRAQLAQQYGTSRGALLVGSGEAGAQGTLGQGLGTAGALGSIGNAVGSFMSNTGLNNPGSTRALDFKDYLPQQTQSPYLSRWMSQTDPQSPYWQQSGGY